jgi:enoyl-CoA hydratase/carnithine racemase
VNGASVGVGATMILPCDIIMASENAKFAMGFIKMGLVPELASSHFLVQRMGFGRASEMCLTGKLYTPGRRTTWVWWITWCPTSSCSTALELAGLIAANPGPQLRWIKELISANGCATDLASRAAAGDGNCCTRPTPPPSTRRRWPRFSRSGSPTTAGRQGE